VFESQPRLHKGVWSPNRGYTRVFGVPTAATHGCSSPNRVYTQVFGVQLRLHTGARVPIHYHGCLPSGLHTAVSDFLFKVKTLSSGEGPPRSNNIGRITNFCQNTSSLGCANRSCGPPKLGRLLLSGVRRCRAPEGPWGRRGVPYGSVYQSCTDTAQSSDPSSPVGSRSAKTGFRRKPVGNWFLARRNLTSPDGSLNCPASVYD